MEKSRNGGNWTEGRFRGFITSTLRGGMRRWPPKWEALKAACVGAKKNPRTGRLAKHYNCANCTKHYIAKAVQVDHISPVVDPAVGFVSWDVFIERLFTEQDNLQVLCLKCHKAKTSAERPQVTKLVTSKKKTKNDRKANRKK